MRVTWQYFIVVSLIVMNAANAAERGKPKKPRETFAPTCDARILGLESDANFLAYLRFVPAENWDSRFENYKTITPSQSVALDKARKFSDYRGNQSIGYALSGAPGLGKTHLAIAIARKAYADGARVLFMTPETLYDKFRGQSDSEVIFARYDMFILDDVNPSKSPENIYYGDMLTRIVHYAHRVGGKKILVTTNADMKTIADEYYLSFQQADKARFNDRVRTMFVEQVVKGESARPTADWD